MNGNEWLTDQFEANRAHLRAVAYRMLGSLGEADDAVQECWLRLRRADTSAVENLKGWLTTVVAHVCLDMLRSRKSRREEQLDLQPNEGIAASSSGIDPEDETLLAEAVGIALLVVLERLAPAERVAFVLHDVFAVSFDDIAAVVKRTPAAARQLASRARRRVRGTTTVSGADLSEQRAAVEQFLAALRTRDLDALLAVLDPDVVRRADSTAVAPGAARELRGAATVIEEALKHTDTAKFARPVLVNESVGIVVAPRGHVRVVIRCTVKGGKITEMNVIADPTRISKLNLALLEN